jgi:hypothetical protein
MTIDFQEKPNFTIFKEKPGVISKDSCWICICEGYLYTGDTLEELISTLNSEWKLDKHIAGY